MPTTLRTLVTIGSALTGLIGWGLLADAGAPPSSGPNVAQVDLVNDWDCARSAPGAIPDLQVAITTTGGPLLVLLNLNLHNPLLDVEADMLMTPVIDGALQTGEMMRFQVMHGEARPGWGAFAFSRLYPVPAGRHTVSWEGFCLSNLTVVRGWLTVYELPLAKR